MARTVALSELANEFQVSVATVEDALEGLLFDEVGPPPRPAGKDAEYIASEPDTDTLMWFRTALKLARRL